MAANTAELITSLYDGLVLHDPTASESTYWQNEVNIGTITPVGIALLGIATTEFMQVTLKIAMLFEASFGRYGTNVELQAWRTVYDTGLNLSDMGQRFITSNEFKANNPDISSTADYLQAMAATGLGRDVTQAELDVLVPQVDAGTLNYGDIMKIIIDHNSRGMKVGMAMISAALNGAAPDTAAMDALDTSSVPAAINTLILASPFYTPVAPTTLSLSESAGELTLIGPLSSEMLINLTTRTATIDGANQILSTGSLDAVTSVDATRVTDAKITFTGSSAADTYKATPSGDTITGGTGDDLLFAGTGADTFVFASTAPDNGLDIITNFQRDTTPDILDFSAFLTVTGTAHIATVDAATTAEATWANGDVLTVSGYNLTTAADIAALFGADQPFAAPTARGKAVIITTDIIGDASVWYLVNQVDATTITADEITQTATLTGVNNLELISFSTTNFA